MRPNSTKGVFGTLSTVVSLGGVAIVVGTLPQELLLGQGSKLFFLMFAGLF